jgi:AraC-like DNA-binding protein
MQACPVEAAIARKFRLDRAPTLLAQPVPGAPITFSRLRCDDGACRGPTLAAPPEEAYSFAVALMPIPVGEIWIDGRHSRLPAAPAGSTSVYDLSTSPVASLTPSYDFLRVHLPLAAMAQALLPMIEAPALGSTLFLDAVALAFYAYVLRRYGDLEPDAERGRSGLAPWQLRRAYAFMEARLDGDTSIAELAQECRLSASHFARAFRQATGLPPHRWLLRRRVERAKELLSDGALPLAQVALACGFVDQSHLNRVFTRTEGHSPGRWRRLRSA